MRGDRCGDQPRIAGSATASGNVLTINAFGSHVLSGVTINLDTTGEFSGLVTLVGPKQRVRLVEVPVTAPSSDCSETNHLNCVAPAGMTFSGAVFSGSLTTPFTFSAVADGIKTFGTLRDEVNNQIANGIGTVFCAQASDSPDFPLPCASAPFGGTSSLTIVWTIRSQLRVDSPAAAQPVIPEPKTNIRSLAGFMRIA